MGRRPLLRIKINNKVIVLLIIVLFFSCMIFLLEYKLKPTIKTIAQAKTNLITNEIINRVIYDEILQDVKYQNLIEINRDANNKVTFIQANTIQISRIMAETNIKLKEALDGLSEQEFSIPLGQAMGSYLFATYGPKLKVKILPAISELEVNLQHDFHEAGINQTRHILYLNIHTAIRIVIPMISEKVIVTTTRPIAETIIVGPIPNTMLRLDGLNSLLRGISGQ
jgi:sporulation protein YunB